MEGIGRALGRVFGLLMLLACLAGVLLGAFVWVVVSGVSKDIEVKTKLEPIRIEIKENLETNTVDTLYIYKIK